MERFNIWIRLLWREYRASRFTALVLLAVPPLVYLLSKDPDSLLSFVSFIIALTCLPLLVILWAGENGDRQREGHEFAATNLPLWSMNDWLASFLITLLTAALLGAWCGGWLVRSLPGLKPLSITIGAEAGALYIACCYVVSYFFSQSVAFHAGILSGVISGIMATRIFDVQDIVSGNLNQKTVAILIRVLIGICAGSLVYAWFSNRISLKIRKAVSFSIVIVTVFSFYIMDYLPSIKIDVASGKSFSDQLLVMPGTSSYTSISQKRVSKGNRTGIFEAVYKDSDNNRKLSRIFKADGLCLADVYNARYVYLLEQQHKVDHLNLLMWDTATDRITTVMPLPKIPLRNGIQMGGLWRTISSGSQIGHISPDRKFLLLILSSLAGDGIDLWVVDLQHKTARIALPNSIFGTNDVVWTRDYAVISGVSDAVKLNLKTFDAKIIKVNWNEGDKQ